MLKALDPFGYEEEKEKSIVAGTSRSITNQKWWQLYDYSL